MVRTEEFLQEIRETKIQIRKTESGQRKYELHRHLNKLLKEWEAYKRYGNRKL